ncbi:hypothetical protein MNV_1210011 [Candidatus Methanoperedens nitroreducens]|uniref:Uncharacterized protein n=1 Tax=Candidatus Methanoperedens nitratireducens TaxID=1392998 RepID=A0A284VJU9_9EURY|nr:hypothetical protein MNV_1210011 [Candidatus Methanoperedens nitroreducens]
MKSYNISGRTDTNFVYSQSGMAYFLPITKGLGRNNLSNIALLL